MKKVAKRVISLVLAVMMVFTSMLFGVTEEVKADDYTYALTITKDSEAVPSSAIATEVGTTNTFKAKLTAYDSNGAVAAEYDTTDEFTAAGLKLSWWVSSGTADNLTCSNDWEAEYSATANVAGEYWFGVGVYQTSDPWGQCGETVYFGINATEDSGDEVTYTVEVLQDGKVVSGGSVATASAIVGEDTTFTAKITKTDVNGNTTVITDLTDRQMYWYDKTTQTTTSGQLSYTINKETTGEYWYDVTFRDETGTSYTTWFGIMVTEEALPEYEITVIPSAPTGEEGETISLTATVTVDGEEVTDLAGNDLAVYWWTDDNTDNGVTYDSSNSTLTNSITLNKAGTYNFTVKLNQAVDPWSTLKTATFTLTVEEGENPVIDYAVTITPETTDITKGDIVKLDAKVTVDEVEVTDLEAAGLQIVWSATEEGLSDIEFDHTSLYALTTNAKLPSEGSYFVTADISDANGEVVATAKVELIAKAPEDEVRKIDLPNDDFSEEIVENDPVWKGSTKSGNWTNNRFYRFAYSSDAWLELASYCSGAYCMKMEAVAGDALQVVQYVETLEAGTYTLVVPVMGGDGSVKLVLGDQESEAKALQGWNNWSYVKVTFTVEEDMTDVPVGIKLVSSSSVGGWAFVDSISLYKGVPATGDNHVIWTYVILLMAGVAVTAVGMKKKHA